SGASVALVSRSGLDLRRFGLRYSHAGISLKASPNTPWSVRQLYYACDEGRPRLFDQGLSGFLLGTDDPAIGYVSVVLLPKPEAEALEQAALDNARALQLLNATYSANAYAWGLRYQNCNQWVAELLAAAWGHPADDAAPRAEAQRWLAAHGYVPTRVKVGNRLLMWAGAFVPWLHDDDHPSDDVAQMVFRISMPESIERFVRGTVPGAMLRADAATLPGVPHHTLHIGLPHTAAPAQIRDAVQSWLQRQARRVFEERCQLYTQRLGVRYTRLTLSSAQTRWGSASADGSIRLNWRLIHFALPTIDYVVTHELAHLREMNHSPRFWDVVRSVLPDYERSRETLKDGVVPVFE
ncbi:MAG: DUF2145 domain-containing protein, partial [Rhizobacter sp.]